MMDNYAMKAFILIPFFMLSMIVNGCEEIDNVSNDCTSGPTKIRLGSKYNLQRGVTITWHSNETEGFIKWGYTTGYEFGEFTAECRDEYNRNLFDFTFPILEPLSEVHYSIKSGNEWGEDKKFNTSADTLSNNFSFVVGGDSHAGDSLTLYREVSTFHY